MFALAPTNLQAGYLWWSIAQFTLPEQSDWCDNMPIRSYNYAPVLPVNMSRPYFSTRPQDTHEKVGVWGWDYPGCEVICQGVPNHLASSLRPCFVEASLTVEKAVLCYKAYRLVVSLPSFCSVQSLLAVREFRAAEEEHCEQGHNKCVRTFDGCCGAQSASDQSQVCELNEPTFWFTMQEFSMVGSYTEDLKKSQNCQNWGVGACTGTYGDNTYLCI